MAEETKDDVIVNTVKEEYEKKLQSQKDEYEKKLKEKEDEMKKTEEKYKSQVREILTGSKITTNQNKEDDEEDKSWYETELDKARKILKITK